MSLADCGAAVVLIYGDGRLETTLVHPQDGGEAYMGPLLRKAVQYAKTHYDSGSIADVLLSEGEMRRAADAPGVLAAVEHIYYVSYRWNERTGRKTYRVEALHPGRMPPDTKFPEFASNIPIGCARLV